MQRKIVTDIGIYITSFSHHSLANRETTDPHIVTLNIPAKIHSKSENQLSNGEKKIKEVEWRDGDKERERESVCVCVRERERERKRESLFPCASRTMAPIKNKQFEEIPEFPEREREIRRD